MKVEIYSDVACPWCYIGERRFARALAALPGGGDVEVAFRPYQLDPGAPAAAMPVAQYLQRRFGRPVDDMLARVTKVAAEEGITMDWDRALAVSTRAALRLVQLAGREYGATVQRALVDRLFEAHFSRGGNVSDHAQLAGLAAAAGMDPERAQGWLASGEGEAELDAALEAARALGVQAVPTFVFDGRFVVEGAQPASTFLQVLEEVRRRAAEPVLDDADGEGCAEGSCTVGGEAR